MTSHMPTLSDIFGAGGLLSKTLAEYEFRPEQLDMSEMIYRGMMASRHVLVEAGTGTGKTLAYLAPALLSGKKVVISTGTKALQEQLFHKDVPLIRKVLPMPFLVAYMKGRSNYLCRSRFQEFGGLGLFDSEEEVKQFAWIGTWVKETRTGDVAEIAFLSESSSLWRRVNAGVEACLGGKCPDLDKCFITRMRREAAKADVLIVNHHLFFADLSVKEKGYGEVIPEYDTVVFDEAHMLEEVATRYFGIQLSNYRLEELIRDARQGVRECPNPKDAKRVEQVCSELELKTRDFFSSFLKRGERFQLVREEMEGQVQGKETELLRLLNSFAQDLKSLSFVSESMASLVRRATEISGDLKTVMELSAPGRVYWCEIRGKGVFLHASPIDVSLDLSSQVFSKVPCAVLTSATLTAGGSFRFIQDRLGLLEADKGAFPSAFDYRSQALLYLPKMENGPDGKTFLQEAVHEIRKILEQTQGRALILFTSRRHLDWAYEVLGKSMPYPLLKQGDASREALLAQFREQTESVLLATRSFWQGIDVQGDALSCVIIDKLPFAVPSEPVVAARIEAIRSRGGNPFYEYQVPEAVISLKQGFGRLIRNKKDRGLLSILDNRIQTRSYGKLFLRSLPPCPLTHEIEEIERFFSSQEGAGSRKG